MYTCVVDVAQSSEKGYYASTCIMLDVGYTPVCAGSRKSRVP